MIVGPLRLPIFRISEDPRGAFLYITLSDRSAIIRFGQYYVKFIGH